MSLASKSYQGWQNELAEKVSRSILFQNDQSLYNKTVGDLLDHINVLEHLISKLKEENEKTLRKLR